MHASTFLLPCLLLLAGVDTAYAATIERVDIRGLNEEMTENVRGNLSLDGAIGRELSPRRLEYLMQIAERETREALEPFGYYSPSINVQTQGGDAALVVTLDVVAGEPVRVRVRNLGIVGDGEFDPYLEKELEQFLPQIGDVLDHRVYEAGRTRITRRLTERGYFDADYLVRQVRVTRADAAADIELRWDSGERYDMGEVRFTQVPEEIVDPKILQRLVYWEQGEYYHQGRLDRLRRSLVGLDYFSNVDIQPKLDEAEYYEVPVDVTLVPAPRTVYTAGASYGTLSGFGVLLGAQRRYLNRRGHKTQVEVDWARVRKTATVQYRVPAFAWLDGWYSASVQFADEQTDYMDSRRLEGILSRSGQYNQRLNLVASLHGLRERWAYVPQHDPNAPVQDIDAIPLEYRYANYLYPSVRAEYIKVDNRLEPRRGYSGTVMVRGGVGSAGDDSGNLRFSQIHARAHWYRGFGENARLMARGEFGHTFADEVVDIAPSLRFFAGGDRSIRGYNWREVGPRIVDVNGRTGLALGAKNVMTASVEYEHYVYGPWGLAAFVDTGSAFNGRIPDWHTGVGVGVRWRSPIGPVRVDIARGLNTPDSPFTVHLNIGADL